MLQSIKNRIINYSDELNLEAYIKECNETGFVPYHLYVGDGKDLGNWFKNLNFSILDDNTLLNLLKTIIKTKTFEFYLNGVYHEKIFDKLRFPEIYELSSKMGLLNNKKKVLYRFNFSDNEGDN